MAQLIRYGLIDSDDQNKPSEYVAIVMDETVEDNTLEGYEVRNIVEVDDDDVGMFPCDRPLFAR
jgi:hypothetical protein